MLKYQFLAACVMIQRRPICQRHFQIRNVYNCVVGTPHYQDGRYYIRERDTNAVKGPYELIELTHEKPDRYWSAISPVSRIVRSALNDSTNGIGQTDEKIAAGLLDLALAALKAGRPYKECDKQFKQADTELVMNESGTGTVEKRNNEDDDRHVQERGGGDT